MLIEDLDGVPVGIGQEIEVLEPAVAVRLDEVPHSSHGRSRLIGNRSTPRLVPASESPLRRLLGGPGFPGNNVKFDRQLACQPDKTETLRRPERLAVGQRKYPVSDQAFGSARVRTRPRLRRVSRVRTP